MSLMTRILLKMPYQGRHKTEVWDPSIPKRIGPRFYWIIERTGDGFLIRNIRDGSFREIKNSDVGPEKEFSLPSTEEASEARTLIIQPQRTLRPLFESHPEGGFAKEVLVYACIGPWILSMNRITAGMIAAVRGHPIFTLNRKSEGYELKVQVSGVRIHSPTQKIETKAGDTYEIPFEDLPKTSIRRGRRKWIFQYSHTPPVGLFDGLKGLPTITSESYWVGGLGSLVLGALISLWMWVQSVPVPEQIVEPIPEKKEVVVQVKPPEPYVESVRTPPPPPKVVEMKDEPTPNLKKARSDTPGPAPVKKEMGGKAVKKENPPVLDLTKLKGALSRFSEKSESGFVSDKAVRKDLPSDHAQVFDSKAVGHVMDPIDPNLIRPDVQVSKVGGLPGADYTDLRSNAVTGKVGAGDYAQVSPGGGSVDEGLTKEEVDSVVQIHMREVRECHQSAPMGGLLSEGKLEIAFLITSSGRVQDQRVAESSLQNSKLENCVMERMKSWQFPRPAGNVSVKVSYPFFFRVLGR